RGFDELPPGSSRQVEFTVRNFGTSRVLKVTVIDGRHFVSKAEPAELMLGPGQSAIVRVNLTVPAGTSRDAEDDVIVTATSTSGPFTSNYVVAHFSVTGSDAAR